MIALIILGIVLLILLVRFTLKGVKWLDYITVAFLSFVSLLTVLHEDVSFFSEPGSALTFIDNAERHGLPLFGELHVVFALLIIILPVVLFHFMSTRIRIGRFYPFNILGILLCGVAVWFIARMIGLDMIWSVTVGAIATVLIGLGRLKQEVTPVNRGDIQHKFDEVKHSYSRAMAGVSILRDRFKMITGHSANWITSKKIDIINKHFESIDAYSKKVFKLQNDIVVANSAGKQLSSIKAIVRTTNSINDKCEKIRLLMKEPV